MWVSRRTHSSFHHNVRFSDPTTHARRFQIACKYVRREFRYLCDKDRTAYFDALSIIYHTSTTEGSELYGVKYRGSGVLCIGRRCMACVKYSCMVVHE